MSRSIDHAGAQAKDGTSHADRPRVDDRKDATRRDAPDRRSRRWARPSGCSRRRPPRRASDAAPTPRQTRGTGAGGRASGPPSGCCCHCWYCCCPSWLARAGGLLVWFWSPLPLADSCYAGSRFRCNNAPTLGNRSTGSCVRVEAVWTCWSADRDQNNALPERTESMTHTHTHTHHARACFQSKKIGDFAPRFRVRKSRAERNPLLYEAGWLRSTHLTPHPHAHTGGLAAQPTPLARQGRGETPATRQHRN